MKSKTKKARRVVARVTEGSGNVFADVGLPNPEEELRKARLRLKNISIRKNKVTKRVKTVKSDRREA